MRFLAWVVSGAIFLFLLYILVGLIVDGYFDGNIVPDGAVPNSWTAPDSWSEWRDILIVFTFFFWMFAGVLLIALLAALFFLTMMVRRIVKQNAVPAIDSLKASLDNIRGTTEFAGETVVSPIIRTYAVVKGVRTGLSAVTGLPDRVRGRKKKKRFGR